MAPNLVGNGHDGCKVGDGPRPGSEAGEVDHAAGDGDEEGVHPLEVAHDAVETDAEARGLKLFRCGGPFHIDAAGMADEGFAHVEGQAAEKENELFGILASMLYAGRR